MKVTIEYAKLFIEKVNNRDKDWIQAEYDSLTNEEINILGCHVTHKGYFANFAECLSAKNLDRIFYACDNWFNNPSRKKHVKINAMLSNPKITETDWKEFDEAVDYVRKNSDPVTLSDLEEIIAEVENLRVDKPTIHV